MPRIRRSEQSGPIPLYGLHAVRAALENPIRIVQSVLATTNGAARLDAGGTRIEIVDARKLDRLVGADAVHQGVVALVEALPEIALRDIVPGDLIVVLDQITDPHNVGAILRSAVALGACAVVTTRRNAAAETGVLAKSASGALDHIPLVRVGNLTTALNELRAMGYHSIGLDSDGDHSIEASLPDGPIALILGAEGRGLRERTRDSVDVLASLDMPGPIRSLNVSNAAALSLYIARRHLDGRRQGLSANAKP